MQIKFYPTVNKTVVSGKRQIDVLVIHTMEAPEKGTTAEATAMFFQRASTKASAHYNFDNNSVCSNVKENDVAWAAPGANHDGVQFEHAGYAKQVPADWADPFSKDMLALSAEVAAGVCERHDLPVVFRRAPELAAGLRGITTHWEVSRAYGLSTHWDPGSYFPINNYLTQIKVISDPDGPQIKDPPPLLQLGDQGWRVKQAQRLLNHAGQHIEEDGIFGTWMRAGVKGFQKRAGLNPTGNVGEYTWKALWQVRYLGWTAV